MTDPNPNIEVSLKLEEQAKDRSISNSLLKDHFTLNAPSSTISFSNYDTCVITEGTDQFILEAKDGQAPVLKKVSSGSAGLFFLRGFYSLVAVLMSGFLLVFCIQLILFLFLGLAIESGLTSQHGFKFFPFFGHLFAIPVFCIGLANALTICVVFVQDTWKGHPFMKSVTDPKSVVMEWFSILVFLIVPVLVGAFSLCVSGDDWWRNATITWFVCVFLYYLIFAALVIYYEVEGAFELIRYHPKVIDMYTIPERELETADSNTSNTFQIPNKEDVMGFFEVIKNAILVRVGFLLSGTQTCYYMERGTDEVLSRRGMESIRNSVTKDMYVRPSLYSRITQWSFLHKLGLYESLDQPDRLESIDEIRSQAPLVTGYNWNLETLYCRNRDKRYIAVVNGDAKITDQQATSSFLCAFLGYSVFLFSVIAFMLWFTIPPAVIGVLIAILVITTYATLRTSWQLYSLYKSVKKDDDTTASVIYQMKEEFRITRPSKKLCWVFFIMEVVFLVLVPLAVLFSVGNYPVAIVFLLTALITGARRFVNVGVFLQELGSIEGIEVNNKRGEAYADEKLWAEQHRLTLIAGEISSGRTRNFWTGFILFFIFIFCALFMTAAAIGFDDGSTATGMTLVNDFAYGGNPNLPYPTCGLVVGEGTQSLDKVETSLVDYTFLANLAYVNPSVTQKTLDNWFGSGVAVDKVDVVTKFEAERGANPVHFKLIEFANSGIDVVSIRGTNNAWDALSDAQLWSSAALAQYIRALLPLGELWTPILQYLVKSISLIESHNIEQVAYYKSTTAFVNQLKNDNVNVQVTGHSLGGGLAMITGAQTQTSAVALSGPNTMISRLTFDPVISPEELDNYTFNIVPDRDPVPRIDDLANNYQRIKCRSKPNDPVGCHFGVRSLCELLYECGSNSRPVPCECVHDYGYEKPVSLGGRTFEEACPKK